MYFFDVSRQFFTMFCDVPIDAGSEAFQLFADTGVELFVDFLCAFRQLKESYEMVDHQL